MKKFAVFLSGLAMGVAANAASISFDFSNPLETTEISQSGSLGLFDSSLGTLTGVSLRVFGSNDTTIGVNNSGSQTETAKTTSTTALYFTSGLAGLDALFAATNDRELVTLTNTTGLQIVNSGASLSFGPLKATDSRDLAVSSGSSLWSDLQLAGGGLFSVNCMSLSSLTVAGGGGNINSTQATTAQCGAEVVYTYDAAPPPANQVPEPGSFALAGLALMGAAAVGRRRKSA